MKYIFTEEQFMTLLSLAGMKECYLFQQQDDYEDDVVVGAIADLYRTGRILRTGGHLVPEETLACMIREMGQAEHVVRLQYAEEPFSQHLLYVAGKGINIVLEKQFLCQKFFVKLWREEANYYVHEIFENEMLPENLLANRLDAQSIEERAWKEMPMEYEEKEFFLRAQRIQTVDGETDSRIDVFHASVFQWIHVYEGYEEYYHLYSSEELAELLLRELKGEKI